MLIKVKYLRNDKPYGKEYTFRSGIEVEICDLVELPNGATAVVVAINVPEEEVAAFADKVKAIVGLAKVEAANDSL